MSFVPSALAGLAVDERYRLVASLGEGTFGEVWRASDLRLAGRDVAVKLLKHEFLERGDVVTRFEAEADALALLEHANIVAILDRGVWNGRRFLVTEFVPGVTLRAWLDGFRSTGRPSDLAAVRDVFEQLCAGLDAAHRLRVPGPVVHRDLKPDNVLLRTLPSGEIRAKVLDFGIAQLGGRQSTRTGALMGNTPVHGTGSSPRATSGTATPAA